MQYDLHPIFVHFPIALLSVYSIVKILPFQKWLPKVSWKHIERILLVVGVSGAFLALATGDTAERLAHANRQLVNAHSTFAGLATWLYGALLLGEILSVYNPDIFLTITSTLFQKILVSIEQFLTQPFLSRLIAFVALVVISITGLLGGVIVYGTTADPAAGLVLKMLGILL